MTVTSSAPPETLDHGRYQLVRPISEGGFGRTFLALDQQMPSQRYCVIKQLKPIHHDPKTYAEVLKRFKEEARALQSLGENWDRIPTLLAYFEENQQFYLVQEWIEGETLAQVLSQKGVFSEARVCKIVLDLLPTLARVHSQQRVHRDIKPENIVLRQQDGQPVLLDFGAVKELMRLEVRAPHQSGQSVAIGTLGFMPPEQAAGHPIPGSDLYALGLTAIYLLTGKMPFELGTDPQTGGVVWQSWAPSLSPGLAAVLERAIQPYPQGRFRSATEMEDALLRLNPADLPAPSLTAPGHPAYPTAQTVLSAPSAEMAPTALPPSGYGSRPSQSHPTEIYQAPPQQPYVSGSNYSSSGYAPAASGDWKKALILGGLIGASILGGAFLVVAKLPDQPSATASPSAVSPEPTPEATPEPTPEVSPAAVPPVTPVAVAPVSPPPAPSNFPGNATVAGEPGSKNVRSGPSTSNGVIGQVSPGERVMVVNGSQNRDGYLWYEIQLPTGPKGWIASHLLNIDGDAIAALGALTQDTPVQNAPIAVQPPVQPPQAPEAPQTNATIVGESGSKNIRGGPGTSYDAIHIAYPGDRVQLTNQSQDPSGYLWYEIYFPESGASGWIAAQLIQTD